MPASLSRRARAILAWLASISVIALLIAAGVTSVQFLNQSVQNLNILAKAVGFGKPQTYLLVFQNTAEARGTGGILGAYSVIRFEDGHPSVLRYGSDADLESAPKLPLSMPAEYLDLYGQDPAIWQNSNLSPHFPYAAQIWLALWERQFSEKLDGVISVDPVSIKTMLHATGPVIMKDGEKISADNVVRKTLSGAYQRFESDNIARKQYLVELMGHVLARTEKLSNRNKLVLGGALIAPAQQGHILAFNQNPQIQSAFEKAGVSGELSNLINNEYRAVIINTDASKLDYYLETKVRLSRATCEESGQVSFVVTVTNGFDGKTNLPDYVWGRLDKNQPGGLGGAHAVKLLLYGPTGSSVVASSRQNYELGSGNTSVERSRALVAMQLDLAPGESERVQVVFTGGDGPLTYHPQPLVRPTRVNVTNSCGQEN